MPTFNRTFAFTVIATLLLATAQRLPAPISEIETPTPIVRTPTPLSNVNSAQVALQEASKERPWQNSLGMRFVPVLGTEVLFSIWDTRVRDFAAFVEHSGYDGTGGMYSVGKDGWKQRGGTWKEPGFSQGPTYPVVGVNWNDAKAFCDWLTKTEHESGALPQDKIYRLPTDEEWSIAVGLSYEAGSTPKAKDEKIVGVYPWGQGSPPPQGAGNYRGEESKIGNEPTDWTVINGYNDGWPRTSPVGSFAGNKFGLYDLGGNVWQWCEDWYDASRQARVLRGGSWSNSRLGTLLSSCRGNGNPAIRYDYFGFRCVVAPGSSR